MPSPIIVVHGGAWAIPDEACQAHRQGVERASAAGWKALERGASSLDAVEEAVATLEDDETFDAGRGAFLNRDGRVQLDALIMDGATLKAGGVGCVERLLNPVRAARVVLEKSPSHLLRRRGRRAFCQRAWHRAHRQQRTGPAARDRALEERRRAALPPRSR